MEGYLIVPSTNLEQTQRQVRFAVYVSALVLESSAFTKRQNAWNCAKVCVEIKMPKFTKDFNILQFFSVGIGTPFLLRNLWSLILVLYRRVICTSSFVRQLSKLTAGNNENHVSPSLTKLWKKSEYSYCMISVHKLRPEDIRIVAALGDSLTVSHYWFIGLCPGFSACTADIQVTVTYVTLSKNGLKGKAFTISC